MIEQPTGRRAFGLRSRAALALGATGMLIPAAGGLWATLEARSSLADRAEEGQLATATAVAAENARGMDFVVSFARAAATRPGLLAWTEARNVRGQLGVLRNIHSTGGLRALAVFDPGGSLMSRYPVALSPEARGAVATGSSSRVFPPRPVDDDAIVVVREPMVSPEGRRVGVLVAEVSFRQTSPSIGRRKPGETAAVSVVDRAGRVLVTSEPARVGARLQTPELLGLVRDAEAGTTDFFARATDRDEIGAFAPVEEQPWGILVTEAKSEVLAPANRLARGLAIGVAALISIGALIALLVSRGFASYERQLRERTAEQERARQAALLADVSASLIASLDYEETLDTVVRLQIPRLADASVVAVAGEEDTIERAVTADEDPAGGDSLARLGLALTGAKRPPAFGRTIASGQAAILAAPELYELVGTDEQRELLWSLGVRTAMLLPLRGRDRMIGVLALLITRPDREYGPSDLAFAAQVADRCALAMENARLFHERVSVAEILQASLLPEQLPDLPGLTLAARYRPGGDRAEVGGDWYDAFELPRGEIALVMGDVVGRGVPAATVMGQLRSVLRAFALEGHAPGAILDRLSHLLRDRLDREIATLVYVVVDPDTWSIRVASAGHPPPLVRGSSGRVEYLETPASVPLGAMGAVKYGEAVASLEKGATLVLYTDGLVERRNEPIDRGLARLADAVANGPDGAEVLCDHIVRELLPGGDAPDDAAVLAFRVELSPSAELRLDMPAFPTALAAMRRKVGRWLRDSGMPARRVPEVIVACSEAVGNAVEHAYGPGDAIVRLALTRTNGTVTVTVRDFGRWRAPRGAHRGRGTQLMHELMDDVEINPGTDGTEVRMTCRLEREVGA